MSNAEPARHAQNGELERVLGVEHAETLMTHLPQRTTDDAATKGDIAPLDARSDRREDRSNRMDDGMDEIQRWMPWSSRKPYLASGSAGKTKPLDQDFSSRDDPNGIGGRHTTNLPGTTHPHRI